MNRKDKERALELLDELREIIAGSDAEAESDSGGTGNGPPGGP